MNLYVINNGFWFELENLTRLFFPNERIEVFKDSFEGKTPFVFASVSDDITVRVHIGDFSGELHERLSDSDGENELSTVKLLYRLLSGFSRIEQPWGLLTGVRPIKLLRKLSGEAGEEEAARRFREDFFVSGEKLSLARLVERNERKILDFSRDDSFSLYIGIPFCPSRCSYCSFVMSSVERAKKLMEPYVGLLCEEIKRTAEIAARLDLRLESVYFGGGTPTSLSAEQLDKLLKTVNESFEMSTCREFTVEAGRPDTVTDDKLFSLKENKVNRISINPQTVSDSVLREIGRKHTARDFYDAFALARKHGFDNINTDLIAGLPTDTPESFKHSLDEMLRLKAESVTVHTLCMKRASRLTSEGVMLDRKDAENAGKMLSYAKSALLESSYKPYYLYRQTRMVGNLENVGWAKDGCESYYNVYVMDETHTILACGSGGVTKLKDPRGDYLKRVFNFKYPYEYISRFEEMLQRKSEIEAFYSQINN